MSPLAIMSVDWSLFGSASILLLLLSGNLNIIKDYLFTKNKLKSLKVTTLICDCNYNVTVDPLVEVFPHSALHCVYSLCKLMFID